MYFPSLISHAAELFRIMIKSPQPPDTVVSEYVRSKKYIGSKERKFISGAVFATLRCKSQSEYIAAAANNAVCTSKSIEISPEIGAALATLLTGEKFGSWRPNSLLVPAAFENGAPLSVFEMCKKTLEIRCSVEPDIAENWTNVALKTADILFDCVKNSSMQEKMTAELAAAVATPVWILEEWSKDLGVQGAIRRAKSLTLPAPVGARVNSMAMERSAAMLEFERLGIEASESALAPDGIELKDRVNILQSPIYLRGAIEIQDIGSQLVGYAVAPKRDDSILDACAGAGGKALHLATLQRNAGRVICSDAEPRRMRPIAARAARCGINSIVVDPRFAGDEILPDRFDIVVVDAPCSGMGTIRRNPSVKWRLTLETLRKISRKQSEILQKYARYTQNGGALVYVTCSLMREENEEVAAKFIRDNPEFAPDDLHDIFTRSKINASGLEPGDFSCRLAPDTHGTDGFYIARFIRKSA